MSNLTITCPSCNETFSADQALQNHLKDKELKFQEEIKVKEKLLKEKFNLDFKLKEKNLEKELSLKVHDENRVKIESLQSKVLGAEKSKKDSEAKMAATIKQRQQIIENKFKEKENALEKNKKEAEAKMIITLKQNETALEKNKKEAEAKMIITLKQKETALEDKQKDKFKELQIKAIDAEKSKKQMEVKHLADMRQKEQILESKHKEKSESEIQKIKELMNKKDKENEIKNNRQLIKMEEMAKQIKQKSVEVQGEVQEELIEDYLRNKFPNDTVEEIKKGAKGADCILTINNKDDEKLAQIYFESKDHKSFKEEWVTKLLSDMKDKNINYGVLITTAMPKDYNKQQDGYVERHGKRIMIIPMNYQIIHTLVSFIRINLVNEHKSKKEFDAPKALQRLWDHITGPSFQLPLRNLYQTMAKMNDLIGKEKKFFDNNMANKERAMLDMEDDFRDMVKSFTLKVGPECLIQIEGGK